MRTYVLYYGNRTNVRRRRQEHEKKTSRKIDREFIGFTLISGLISFGYNVVMTVIPLRMSDHGQSYGRIGSAMSAVAIGLMVIKLVIGHLSDILGTKKFILSSLAGLAVVSALLARADELAAFTILMAALGIFRGIFLAVSGSYVMERLTEAAMGRYTAQYRAYPPCLPA